MSNQIVLNAETRERTGSNKARVIRKVDGMVPAIERLNKSEIDELVVTNSIPLSHEGEKCSKIRVISLGATIAECIKRLSNEESLSEMFI